MTTIVLPMPTDEHEPTEQSSAQSSGATPRMKVVVHIHAEVLDTEVAKREANAWLLEHVGNFLSATTSELVLGEPLLWRFDVILGMPNKAQPGSGAMYRIGQIALDAISGEVQNAAELATELLAQTQELS